MFFIQFTVLWIVIQILLFTGEKSVGKFGKEKGGKYGEQIGTDSISWSLAKAFNLVCASLLTVCEKKQKRQKN